MYPLEIVSKAVKIQNHSHQKFDFIAYGLDTPYFRIEVEFIIKVRYKNFEFFFSQQYHLKTNKIIFNKENVLK